MYGDTKCPVDGSAFVQYWASAFEKPTVYAWALSRPASPTPATRPRPLLPTQPTRPRPSTHEVSMASWNSEEEGAPPSVNDRTYGPCRPKRIGSVWFSP